jgi:hypothetical protein
MHNRLRILLPLLLLAAGPCLAGQLFQVVIDTSTVATQTGAIYFQFNPGLDPNDLTRVTFPDFSIIPTPPGALLPPILPWTLATVVDGHVEGTLDDQSLTMYNDASLNDYLHFLTFGNQISFLAQFHVPDAVNWTSGSTLSFGLTTDDGLTPILTSDPNGFIGQIGYDGSGAFTTTPLSSGVTMDEVPEPASLPLAGTGLAGLAWLLSKVRMRRRTKGPAAG